MSEMARVSVSPLNPSNSLFAISESVGVSERNLPADLLMLSVMPARLSDMLLNPVKTLVTASESVEVSERARKPVKTLSRASDLGEGRGGALSRVRTQERRQYHAGGTVVSLTTQKDTSM